MAMLVEVFIGQPPVPGTRPSSLYQSIDGFVPCAGRGGEGRGGGEGGVSAVGMQSSGCSVAAGSGRMEVHGIPVVHSDSLVVVIMGVRFVVWWWCQRRNWSKYVLYPVTSSQAVCPWYWLCIYIFCVLTISCHLVGIMC